MVQVGGDQQTYSRVKQQAFQVRLTTELTPSLQAGFLLLTKERLFLWLDGKVRMPEPCLHYEPSGQHCSGFRYPESTLSWQIETTTVELGETRHSDMQCNVVTGCEDLSCKGGRTQVQFCSESDDALTKWRIAIDDTYLAISHLQERLAPAIARAVEAALTTNDETPTTDIMSDCFSPFVTRGDYTKATVDILRNLAAAFSAGVEAHRFGKNSRSGSSFFFSMDRGFIAKRVRDYELHALWKASRNGDYARRIENGTSALNPIYVAFSSLSDSWIVMRAERLAPAVQNLIGDGLVPFSFDVKPPPLTSDLGIASETFIVMHALSGYRFSEAYRPSMFNSLLVDSEFLDANGLVDYSFLLNGAFFNGKVAVEGAAATKDGLDLEWFNALQAAATSKPGCDFSCAAPSSSSALPNLPRQLVDVTQLVEVYNDSITVGSGVYKCCCLALQPGDIAMLRSPCALVNRNADPRYSIMRREACGNLVGDGSWHSYSRAASLPVTNGRCILGVGVWPRSVSTSPEAPTPIMVGPEAAFGAKGFREEYHIRAPCGFMCVSVLDYLLPMNLWNELENVALIPWYGERKWTMYRKRLHDAFRCLLWTSPPKSKALTYGSEEHKLLIVQSVNLADCMQLSSKQFNDEWPSLDRAIVEGVLVPGPFAM